MRNPLKIPAMILSAILACSFFLLIPNTQASPETAPPPQEIAENISCGKCGMYPARYPKWQTEVIFKDGAMVPFDGCKCMFGFLFNMGKFDQHHNPEDVAAIWARDFSTGDWINAKEAHYVIGSNEMGPMGKELIPFGEAAAAEKFQKEHGGELASWDEITMATLKPLMGKMHMKGKMKMEGHGKNM